VVGHCGGGAFLGKIGKNRSDLKRVGRWDDFLDEIAT